MVIFTTLFGYIYELALARNEPQFSHSLDPLLTSPIAMCYINISKYIDVVIMAAYCIKQDPILREFF
jgi:hypothetical protein